MDTTERLLAVADAIEAEPTKFDMSTWYSGGQDIELKGPMVRAGQELECGTACCVAGWAVSLSPLGSFQNLSWSNAGAEALGLEKRFAECLFMMTRIDDAAAMAACLRRLSKVPEGQRDFGHPDVDAALAEVGVEAYQLDYGDGPSGDWSTRVIVND